MTKEIKKTVTKLTPIKELIKEVKKDVAKEEQKPIKPIKEQINKSFIWLDPSDIIFDNANNGREIDKSDHYYTELKENIKNNGVLMPLSGYFKDGKYYLTHGYHRINACIELKEENKDFNIKVHFKVSNIVKSELDILIEHITLNSGKPLSNIELANIILKLENFGLSRIEISLKTSLSTARISQVLSFLSIVNSDTELKSIVDHKVVSDTTLHETLNKINDIEQTKKVINNAIDNAKKDNKSKITKKDITKSIEELKPVVKEVIKELPKIEIKDELKDNNSLSKTYNSFDDLENEINQELEQENIKEIEYKKCSECKNILPDNENLICNECISKDYLEVNNIKELPDQKIEIKSNLNNVIELFDKLSNIEVKKEIEQTQDTESLDNIINNYLSVMRENNKNFIDKLNKNFSKKLNVKDLNEEITDLLLCFIEIES